MKYLFLIFQIVLIVLLILLVVVFVAVMSSENPEWIFDLLGVAEKGEPKYEVLKFLGIGMGGLLVALQALMSYKRAKAMEDTAQAQADAVLKTEQGQQQDRLKNAIEHLGHESDSVRLGGAYELFHLAQDTNELRQTVFDILCAHIRRTTGEEKYRETHKSKPSEEVQSLLTLLFVQEHEVFKGLHINLQGIWLNGADLKGARLEEAVLTAAHLQEAELSQAHLQGAKLEKAHLQGASLNQAYLQGTFLLRTRLQGASLFMAGLQGTFIGETCLQGTDLSEAHLQGAYLNTPYLQDAIFFNTDMRGACCKEPLFLPFAQRMRGAIGEETDLSTAIFSGELSQKDVDDLVKDFLSDEKAEELRRDLEYHIGQPQNFELPGHNVITGSYTEEEAEQWIAEYEEAIPEVPRNNS